MSHDLFEAIRTNDVAAVAALLDGDRALIVDLLLAHAADPRAAGDDGKTPLTSLTRMDMLQS